MIPPENDFDLLTAPWIPAVTLTGETVESGILPLLRGAPQIAQIADVSPVVTFGIYRLLAAVVRHYWRLPNADAWAEAWEASGFDEAFLSRVEACCAGRMRLFDPARPFYQSGDIPLEGKPSEPLKSVGYLAPEASTGTNVAHFSHAGEAQHAFCPACCAKGLVHLPVFALAGGAGIKPGINGVPPLYVLPRGENLYRTLLLNYALKSPPEAAPQDPGPLWEASPRIEARKERNTTGFVESLTWPPRRVRLFPGAGGACSRCGAASSTLVRKMVFAQGWSRGKSLPLWRDPWAPYQRRKSGGADQAELLPLRPSEHKDVWRDFPGLFLREEGAQTARPALLDQLDDLQAEGSLPRTTAITYEVFGLRTDMKAKIFEWRQDCFEFPASLLRSRPAARAIRQALEAAGRCDDALLAALKMLFVSTPDLQALAARSRAGEKLTIPKADVDSRDPLIYGVRRGYWQSLEGRFRAGLGDPRLVAADEQALAQWCEAWRSDARTAAGRALDAALRSFDGDPEGILRQESARVVFRILTHHSKGGPA